MGRVLLAGALLLVACTRRAAPPAPSAAEVSTKGQRLEAFRRCSEASDRLQRSDEPGRAAQLARACADVYSEPACARVMRNPPEKPEAIGAAIAKACREAYCPRLPAPRPSLCAMRELPPPVELARRWRELQSRILALELGVAPDELAKRAP